MVFIILGNDGPKIRSVDMNKVGQHVCDESIVNAVLGCIKVNFNEEIMINKLHLAIHALQW